MRPWRGEAGRPPSSWVLQLGEGSGRCQPGVNLNRLGRRLPFPGPRPHFYLSRWTHLCGMHDVSLEHDRNPRTCHLTHSSPLSSTALRVGQVVVRGGVKSTMAKRILSRARASKQQQQQQAPKVLAKGKVS